MCFQCATLKNWDGPGDEAKRIVNMMNMCLQQHVIIIACTAHVVNLATGYYASILIYGLSGHKMALWRLKGSEFRFR